MYVCVMFVFVFCECVCVCMVNLHAYMHKDWPLLTNSYTARKRYTWCYAQYFT